MQPADAASVCSPVDWRTIRIPRWDSVNALLYPVLVYDVLVPAGEQDDLNIVQRAVLDMARCGVRDLDDMGRRLHLERDLLELVARELTELEYLDDRRLPTKLADDASEARSSQTFHLRSALQDPFTGRLWPYLADRLDPVPIEWDKVPLLRTRAGALPLQRIEAPPEGKTPDPPTPTEILDAAAEAVVADRSDDEDDDPTLWSADEGQALKSARVELISVQPEQWWMPAVALLPEPPDDIDGLTAIGVDGRLGRTLVQSLEVAAKTDLAADRVRVRLDKAARASRSGPHRVYLARVRAEAESDLERRVDARWRTEKILWSELLSIQEVILQVDEDPDRADRLIANALTMAGRLCEWIADALIASHPPPEVVLEQLKKNGNQPRGKVTNPVIQPAIAAANEGWAAGALPEAVRGGARDAESKRPTGFWWHGARLVAFAHYSEAHPFRLLLAETPDWLHEVARITKLRNTMAAHMGEPVDVALGTAAANRAIDLAVTALGYLEPGEEPHGET